MAVVLPHFYAGILYGAALWKIIDCASFGQMLRLWNEREALLSQ